jgi:phosphoribosylcarboxyaminoimidazole (NCAIR) mutase
VSAPPLPELAEVERAEDFFEALGVSYDRRIVSVYRTQILRLLGTAMAALEATRPFIGEDGLRAALRAALRDAHAHVVAEGPAAVPAQRGGWGQLVQLRRPG